MSSNNDDAFEKCFYAMHKLFAGDSLKELPIVTATNAFTSISDYKTACAVTEQYVNITNTYSEPMVWIGIYIGVASIFCVVAMAADLFNGFRNRKLWFPCKYFSLNAAIITMTAVAMKLPVDLSTLMPGHLDQATKVGSMAFMCTMMANLMPSLASMDNTSLLANIIGLVIFVITMIVNICVEISTGVITDRPFSILGGDRKYIYVEWAYVYMVLMFLLLTILISSAIAIPTAKKIIEFKYQAKSKTTSNGQRRGMPKIDKLKLSVRRYWVMAESGSPQFVMACSPLSVASGTICVITLVTHIVIMLDTFTVGLGYKDYQSDYKLSMLFVFITQFIGVVVGSIAPIFRCFTVLRLKLFNRNHFMVFKVEKYWTQMLYGWKESRLPFLSTARRSRVIINNLKNLILSLCIGFQKVVVVSCKMIGLIPIVLVKLFCTTSDATKENLSNYVLKIQDEMEFSDKMMLSISNSMDCLFEKVNKEQHNDLLELLGKSTAGFEGVKKFDNHRVQRLPSVVELVNSWSLPIVTLTCIAVALPDIRKDKVESLLKDVGDGLSYTHLVEESLNSASKYVNVQRAATSSWNEFEDNQKWLERTLVRNTYKGKTLAEILQWFADKAKEIVTKISENTNGDLTESSGNKLIAANSMYRITQTILHRDNITHLSEDDLFALLSRRISDIFSACFTNIPRAIEMKCHESVIEKREGSVKNAAKLLGRSTKIITNLECVNAQNGHQAWLQIEWRLSMSGVVISGSQSLRIHQDQR